MHILSGALSAASIQMNVNLRSTWGCVEGEQSSEALSAINHSKKDSFITEIVEE